MKLSKHLINSMHGTLNKLVDSQKFKPHYNLIFGHQPVITGKVVMSKESSQQSI